MSLHGILLYSGRALVFAAVAGALWLLARLVLVRRAGRPFRIPNELPGLLFVLWLSALVQITVLRAGIDWTAVLEPGRGAPDLQILPLLATFRELKRGLWPFLYPVLGNLLWFLPLGFLLPELPPGRLKPGTVLLAALGLSMGIEALQGLFRTGVMDIDDVLFNVAGAGLGYGLWKIASARRETHPEPLDKGGLKR